MNKELTEAEVKAITEFSYKDSIKKRTKKLTPLEALDNLCELANASDMRFQYKLDTFTRQAKVDELKPIIEKTLKENIELKKMIQNFNDAIGEPQIITPTIEKKLKALEIIKKKRVSTEYFIDVCKLFKKHKGKVLVWGTVYTSELKYYNKHLYVRLMGDPPISTYKKRRYLTQEEFDLLKEVLL